MTHEVVIATFLISAGQHLASVLVPSVDVKFSSREKSTVCRLVSTTRFRFCTGYKKQLKFVVENRVSDGACEAACRRTWDFPGTRAKPFVV